MKKRYVGVTITLSMAILFGFLYETNPNKMIVAANSLPSPKSNNSINDAVVRLAKNVKQDWGFEAIHRDKLPAFDSNGPIKVAVIDTGINPGIGHQSKGYNVLDGSDKTSDTTGHGSDIASILAQMAPDAVLLPVKVLDSTDKGSTENLAKGITWAVDHGAQILNISLGVSDKDPALDKAISYAGDHHVLIVAAAGNEGKQKLDYPAQYSQAISVLARSINNVDIGFSNQDSKRSFSAPGGTIRISQNGDVHYVSGTSVAAPFVTGTAALMLQANLDLTSDQIQQILEQTSTYASKTSWGLIQTDQAVAQAIDKQSWFHHLLKKFGLK